MKDSTSAESRTTWEDLEVGAQRGSRRVRPGVLRPQRSRRVRELDLYHQVQLRRQQAVQVQRARAAPARRSTGCSRPAAQPSFWCLS